MKLFVAFAFLSMIVASVRAKSTRRDSNDETLVRLIQYRLPLGIDPVADPGGGGL